ncbi:hypothetical protein CerSpe_242660 [Prunus speciosa]
MQSECVLTPCRFCYGMEKFGEKSSQTLSSTGYQNVAFKAYNGLGHPGSVILNFIINEEWAHKHYTAKASRGAFSTT